MMRIITLATVAAALVLVPCALADATGSVYNGAGTNTQQGLGTSEPVVVVKGAKDSAPQTTASPTSGTLPFTGMDLGLVGLAGIVLLGLGFSLRQIARDTDDSDPQAR
jgi:hypothetical protein